MFLILRKEKAYFRHIKELLKAKAIIDTKAPKAMNYTRSTAFTRYERNRASKISLENTKLLKKLEQIEKV